METLQSDDLSKLHQGIQQLYTLRDLDTFQVDALQIVDRLVPGDIPEFHLTSLQTRQISFTFLPNFLGFTPAMERVIQTHFEEHPIAQQMPRTLTGVHKISDFISRRELHSMEGLYQQFLRLLDTEDQIIFFLPNVNPISWSKLLQTNTILMGFSTHRHWGKFTERDRLILNLLCPHLLQAFNNARHYQSLQQNLTQVCRDIDGLGLIIIDILGKIQLATSAAIDRLQTYFSNSATTHYLPALLLAWVKHQVAIHQSADPFQKRLPLRIELDGRQLTIRLIVAPDENRYLLLLEEQTLTLIPLRELLGLSPRETEVLYLVIRGEHNNAIAKQLDINVSTVRKHLEHIFAKLDVQSRTEAISQALTKLGLFDSLSV